MLGGGRQRWVTCVGQCARVASRKTDETRTIRRILVLGLMEACVGTISRFGNLGRVFKDGESELLNSVARLSVLYEDLRLEIDELRRVHAKREETGQSESDPFRVMYFIRRALVTLVEFRRGLTRLRQTKEFREAEANLLDIDAAYLLRADQYFQRHFHRIKELRNEFGGHLQGTGVEFSTKHLSDAVGKITWNRSCDGWTLGLECSFAADIVSGAIVSRVLGGTDVRKELENTLDIIVNGFNHAQGATCALVHAFLWDRFGTG